MALNSVLNVCVKDTKQIIQNFYVLYLYSKIWALNKQSIIKLAWLSRVTTTGIFQHPSHPSTTHPYSLMLSAKGLRSWLSSRPQADGAVYTLPQSHLTCIICEQHPLASPGKTVAASFGSHRIIRPDLFFWSDQTQCGVFMSRLPRDGLCEACRALHFPPLFLRRKQR